MKIVLVLVLGWSVVSSQARAAGPVIGTAMAKGSFRIDDVTVTGNATLFEGALVETRLTGSLLDLSSGTHVSLSPDSKGRIFGDRLILEEGGGEINQTMGFHMEARGLTIQPEGGEASVRVMLAGNTRVQIAAISGSLRVLNWRGLLIAAMAQGAAVEFEPPTPQQAGEDSWRLAGCLRAAGSHFLLTDDVTHVTAEITGRGLDAEKGNRVEITGARDASASPIAGAAQLIRANQVRRLNKGCVADNAGGAAAAAGTAGKPGTGRGSKVSVATISIIGGVAAAAILGGFAAAGGFPGSGSSLSR